MKNLCSMLITVSAILFHANTMAQASAPLELPIKCYSYNYSPTFTLNVSQLPEGVFKDFYSTVIHFDDASYSDISALSMPDSIQTSQAGSTIPFWQVTSEDSALRVNSGESITIGEESFLHLQVKWLGIFNRIEAIALNCGR